MRETNDGHQIELKQFKMMPARFKASTIEKSGVGEPANLDYKESNNGHMANHLEGLST